MTNMDAMGSAAVATMQHAEVSNAAPVLKPSSPAGNRNDESSRPTGRGRFAGKKRQRNPRNSNRNNSNNNRRVRRDPQVRCCICETTESVKYKCPKCKAPYCSVACCRKHKGSPACAEKAAAATEACKSTLPKSAYLPPDLLTDDPTANSEKRRQQRDGNGDHRNNDNDDDDDDDDNDSLDEGWKITDEMMKALDTSPWLQDELMDGGLRQIIFHIIQQSDRVERHGRTQQEEQLELAKAEYPRFGMFVDKLLVLAGVLERHDSADFTASTLMSAVGAGATNGDGVAANATEELEGWLKQNHEREDLQQMLRLRQIRPKVTGAAFMKPIVDSDGDESNTDDDDDGDGDDASGSQSSSSTSEAADKVDEDLTDVATKPDGEEAADSNGSRQQTKEVAEVGAAVLNEEGE